MGLGIAMVTANVSRLPVVIMDVNKEQINKGIKFMGNCSCYLMVYIRLLIRMFMSR
jgi:hypothetical protein